MDATRTGCTIDELAGLTGATLHFQDENQSAVISGVCSLDNPQEGCIALALEPGIEVLHDALVLPSALILDAPNDSIRLPQLVHENPRVAFTLALLHFHPQERGASGIHPDAWTADSAEIDPTACIEPLAVVMDGAKIAAGAYIGANTCIGKNSSIGKNTVIYPNVTIMHDVSLGSGCIVHPGVVIGSDGFGFTPTPDGNMKVPQVGRVEIGNNVEIGANSTIDRATLDSTIIEDDVKIDNLVQIAHNCRIGAHTRIAAQAGLSGRVTVEPNVVIAGQAGFQNGIRIGEGSMIGGQAGVTRHVAPGSRISGYPARDHRKSLQLLAAQNRLPELIKKIDMLEKEIKELKQKS